MSVQKAINKAVKERQKINYYKKSKRLSDMANLHATFCPRCRGYLGDYVEGVKVRCDRCKVEVEVKNPRKESYYE